MKRVDAQESWDPRGGPIEASLHAASITNDCSQTTNLHRIMCAHRTQCIHFIIAVPRCVPRELTWTHRMGSCAWECKKCNLCGSPHVRPRCTTCTRTLFHSNLVVCIFAWVGSLALGAYGSTAQCAPYIRLHSTGQFKMFYSIHLLMQLFGENFGTLILWCQYCLQMNLGSLIAGSEVQVHPHS